MEGFLFVFTIYIKFFISTVHFFLKNLLLYAILVTVHKIHLLLLLVTGAKPVIMLSLLFREAQVHR